MVTLTTTTTPETATEMTRRMSTVINHLPNDDEPKGENHPGAPTRETPTTEAARQTPKKP
jgi:hypothetical protein